MAVYTELLLLVQAFMLAVFFIYTIITNDYMPLALVIAMISTVFSLQVLADYKHRFHRNLIFIAPVIWLVFYFVEVVEVQAFFRSLKQLATRQELKWQRWVRVGI